MIAVIIIAIVLYVNRTKHFTFAYKNCNVDYAYQNEIDTTSDQYTAKERAFGKCLADSYLIHPDSKAAKLIIRLGTKYVSNLNVDSNKLEAYKNLDSLLKYRKDVFDPYIVID